MHQIWWERVPNARLFASEIIDSILSDRSTIVQYSTYTPWKTYLFEDIKSRIKQYAADKNMESVADSVSNPGEYLMRRFCKPEKIATYRPSKSYAKFLAESNDIVLHKRYIWVHIDSTPELNSWQDFISEYLKLRGKNEDCAIFILEYKSDERITAKKGIKLFRYADYINEYDRNVFSALAASLLKEPIFIKNYLAELAATLAGEDIELCCECINNYKDFLAHPFETIDRIADIELRSDFSEFEFTGSCDEVKSLIWKAQIKTIYPALEEFRGNFVRAYHRDIEQQLPIKSAFGEIYNTPEEVELGALYFMALERILPVEYCDFQNLKLFRDARNDLSHLDIISIDSIMRISDERDGVYTMEFNA